jgi:hypothetical protein
MFNIKGNKMKDTFFSKTRCDRCSNKLDARTMSWFNDQTICMDCSEKEAEIKKNLPDGGRDHEGCNYLPNIKKDEVSQ